MSQKMYKSRFTLSGFECGNIDQMIALHLEEESFIGFAFVGDTWNGWKCPYFTKSEALRIAQYFNSYGNGTYCAYSVEENCFYYFDNFDEEPRRWEAETIRDEEVFRIGDCFTWEEVESEDGKIFRQYVETIEEPTSEDVAKHLALASAILDKDDDDLTFTR